ncbi:MAG: radical SAM protein [Candidatus Caldatribacteriaceae bacterium]
MNPYTGCSHGCLYCYITSFIPQAFLCREKPSLLKTVARELQNLDALYLSLSNSSDPYPPQEEQKQYTRHILRMCQEKDLPVLILTKSPLVVRDLDILKKMHAVVSITITTLDPYKARVLEPNAPPPEKRVQALIQLSREGIPTVLRLDPIIPELNDNPKEWEEILKTLHSSIKQIVVSTFKPRGDAWIRICGAFPSLASTKKYYTQKEGNSFYLSRERREKFLRLLRAIAHSWGVAFSSCREGFPQWNDLQCDGSSLFYSQSISSSVKEKFSSRE